MGAPATSRPGSAKSPPERSGSPFLSGRSWAPIPCSYSAFILRATKLESKVYHLIWGQTWGLRDVAKRREWTEGMTAEGIARIIAATQSGVSHVLPKLRKESWIGRRRGTKHEYQYTLLDGPVPPKGLPLPEAPRRHAKAKTAIIKGLTNIAASRTTLTLADIGPADTCRNAPECTLTLADIPAAQEVSSNGLAGPLQPECTDEGYIEPDFTWKRPHTDRKGFTHDGFVGLQAAGWIAYEYYLDALHVPDFTLSTSSVEKKGRWAFRQLKPFREESNWPPFHKRAN